MYPILFKLGPLTIYSFGFMMAIAFLVSNYLFSKEAKVRGWDQKHISRMTIMALLGGVVGSKLFSVLEDWDSFMRDPMGQLFSPSGLTFYGGFILAMVIILLYIRSQKLPLKQIVDVLAPIVFLAYGIGRLGCQLAGDGDYGIPTQAPWGMSYANGTVKPTYAFAEHFERYPEEKIVWKYDSLKAIPAGIDDMGHRINEFDKQTPCHPTPLYEFLFAAIAYQFLKRKRSEYKNLVGKTFALTLILMGIERLLVEFLRVNALYAGLSMAQWISIALVIGGIYIFTLKPTKKA